MPAKLDIVKANKADYSQPRKPVLLTVAAAQYLAYDGEGDPNGPGFAEGIGALYGVAWTIKMRKKKEGAEYTVAPLEGLWWTPDQSPLTVGSPKASFRWTALIRTPDFITAADVEAAVSELLRKGKPESVRRVRLERLEEGECVQVLHVGPYSAEAPTIEGLHAFAAAQGRELRGRHHEIYMSDPRRVPPERLKTIIRQPVSAR